MVSATAEPTHKGHRTTYDNLIAQPYRSVTSAHNNSKANNSSETIYHIIATIDILTILLRIIGMVWRTAHTQNARIVLTLHNTNITFIYTLNMFNRINIMPALAYIFSLKIGTATPIHFFY